MRRNWGTSDTCTWPTPCLDPPLIERPFKVSGAAGITVRNATGTSLGSAPYVHLTDGKVPASERCAQNFSRFGLRLRPNRDSNSDKSKPMTNALVKRISRAWQ
jgi:hypothetical protein